MKKTKADSIFVNLFKSLLRGAGFRCKDNNCIALDRDLTVVLSFRNRWGALVPDVYLEVASAGIGTLLQGDIRHLFQEYYDLRAEFTDEELLANVPYTESRVCEVVTMIVAPQSLRLTEKAYFLQQLDAGGFTGCGVYIHAVAALRAAD